MRTNRLLRLLILAAFAFYKSLATADDEITVPDVSGFNTPKAMKAAAGPDMVGVILATKITPPTGSTQLFAYQEPAANTKAPRGSTLKIYIYQSLAGGAVIPSPTPSTSMPDLTGLTLEQAVAQLPPNTQVLADEMTAYPPTPEKALTIFSQTPGKGAPLAPSVTVKRYRSAKTYDASTDPIAGRWVGVSIYKSDVPVEMMIRKEGSRYVLYLVEREFGYPLETDGVRLWHTYTIYDITYQLEGDALVGKWRYTDIKGGEHTGQTTFRRK
jgi:beta-lactam-binding protein with PASTA domain